MRAISPPGPARDPERRVAGHAVPRPGLLPQPLSNCGLPELPATTLPTPGNMAYYGGPVEVKPLRFRSVVTKSLKV